MILTGLKVPGYGRRVMGGRIGGGVKKVVGWVIFGMGVVDTCVRGATGEETWNVCNEELIGFDAVLVTYVSVLGGNIGSVSDNGPDVVMTVGGTVERAIVNGRVVVNGRVIVTMVGGRVGFDCGRFGNKVVVKRSNTCKLEGKVGISGSIGGIKSGTVGGGVCSLGGVTEGGVDGILGGVIIIFGSVGGGTGRKGGNVGVFISVGIVGGRTGASRIGGAVGRDEGTTGG